jgi:hypothetical protein
LPDIVDLEDGGRTLAELGVEHGAELVGGGDEDKLRPQQQLGPRGGGGGLDTLT